MVVEKMPKIKEMQRIYDVVKSIKNDEFRLPSIQRSFVWEPEQICKLMDSIMNDYPIGSFLVWAPPSSIKIRTRKFIQEYKTGMRLISEEDATQTSRHLVLDGQQRLQSVYMGFLGKYNDNHLCFKLDSNPSEEENGLRYQFRFMRTDEASKDPHWARMEEVVKLSIEDIPEFAQTKFGADSEESKRQIQKNLAKFIQVFNLSEKIPFQEVKEDMPYNDVLEVFVRVNSGGTVLTKSDLVFATVVLKMPEMERKFVELVDQLNGSGEFDFDIDFLSKASFVLFDKGAKYDVDKLEDNEYIDRLKDGFDKLERALTSTMEFLKTDAKILSKRFLKSDLALVPIVDFIMKQPSQQLPEGQTTFLRQYLYMSFFMRFYSYGPDAKLDLIHKYIKENTNSNVFPIQQIGPYMESRTNLPFEFVKFMLLDLDLILNIIQGGVSEIPKKRGWSLERDHIIPRSLLEAAKIPEELIDRVGNFRLINKTRNILKSSTLDKDAEFFGSDDVELKELYLKACKELSTENLKGFVEKRENLIFTKTKTFLGF
jgi:hypothetical protein